MGVFTLCLGIYFLFYANDLSNKSKEEQYATESLPPSLIFIIGIICIVLSFFI